MAGKETKDYIFKLNMKRLEDHREHLIESRRKAEKLLKKQERAMKSTLAILFIYTFMAAFELGLIFEWWEL